MAKPAHPSSILMKMILYMTLLVSWLVVQAGGWATAALKELPEFAVRDRPVNVVFSMKHHGVQPLRELTLHIVAKHAASEKQQRFTVSELGDGFYTSELVFPSLGFWEWEIETAWPGPAALPPIEVIESSAVSVHETTRHQRGANLFVAKGCVQCHRNARIQLDNVQSIEIGPDLTGYSATPQFLQLWLQDPNSVRPKTTMPDQNLSMEEMSALTVFLLKETD